MAKTKKSSLAGKLGKAGQQGVADHANDEITFPDGGAELPAGIEGGIARLTECRFAPMKSGDHIGEYGFMCAGVVVSPAEFEGERIEGLRTSPYAEPMCETPEKRNRKHIEDHVGYVLNEMRKLGIDTSDVGVDDLEDVAKALEEGQPYFRFSTWQGKPTEQYPKPRVNHDWRGACDYIEDEAADSVVDNTGSEAEVEAEAEDDDEPDLVALAEAADNSDDDDSEEAQKLADAAEEAGIDHEEYDSWVKVVAAIKEATSDDDDDDDDEAKDDKEDDEDRKPEKEEIYMFKPPKKRKAIECEVTAVFTSKKTVNLKSLVDQKSYKSIPWDKLEQVS